MSEEVQDHRDEQVTKEGKWSKLKRSQLTIKLLTACAIRDIRTARLAIDHGANVNGRRLDLLSPLHLAAEHGDVELMKLLCSVHTVNPEAKTIDGLTPLHTAAFLGHIRVIYQLQKIGASVDCEDNLGRRPLHYAAMQKNLECAKYLIRCGAYIHVYDAFEESPAYISVLKTKDVSMIKLLLSYRLRRSPFTPKDSQPLLLQAVLGARDESDIQIIRMILHYSGDIINIPDPIAKRTPLHVVALTGYYELAEYLIDHGANLRAKNRANETPLQVALNCKHHKLVKLFDKRMTLLEIEKFVRGFLDLAID